MCLRIYIYVLLGDLGVECWPLVPKFADLNKKNFSTPSFGGKVKPSFPCRRFTACKRTLECIVEVGVSKKIISQVSRPQIVPPFTVWSSRIV